MEDSETASRQLDTIVSEGQQTAKESSDRIERALKHIDATLAKSTQVLGELGIDVEQLKQPVNEDLLDKGEKLLFEFMQKEFDEALGKQPASEFKTKPKSTSRPIMARRGRRI